MSHHHNNGNKVIYQLINSINIFMERGLLRSLILETNFPPRPGNYEQADLSLSPGQVVKQ